MTVHKSKGLEFPVVFGASMARRYGGRASAEPLLAQRELGLGCLYCDPALQTRRKTLPQLAISERARREDRAEELRVLYVMLTRARDRLELVGSVRNLDTAQMRWARAARNARRGVELSGRGHARDCGRAGRAVQGPLRRRGRARDRACA